MGSLFAGAVPTTNETSFSEAMTIEPVTYRSVRHVGLCGPAEIAFSGDELLDAAEPSDLPREDGILFDGDGRPVFAHAQ
jgi:hypothetical protein